MEEILYNTRLNANCYKTTRFWLTVLITELVFFKTSLNLVLCILLAICLLYLYIIKKEKILVFCFLLLANDALGQIFYTVSVKYLYFVFLLYELIVEKGIKINKRVIPIGVIGLYIIFQPFISGLDDANMLINTLFPMLLLLILYQRYTDKELFLEEFTFGVSVIVSLLALHACLTGGYAVKDYSDVTGYVRKGILGVGIGDSNFSCLILCSGITCILNCRVFSKWIKLLLSLIICGAIALTLSTTGLLCLCIILILSGLINKNLSKRAQVIILIVFLILVLPGIYSFLPSSMHLSSVDAYINRIQDKYLSLQAKDYYHLSTGRASLGEIYWKYIMNLDILRKLFGGNYLMQYSYFPHNSYIDFIVQFGFVGCGLLVLGMISSLIKKFQYSKHNEYRRCSITLKILYMIFTASISVYHGTTFVMMLFVLFIL